MLQFAIDDWRSQYIEMFLFGAITFQRVLFEVGGCCVATWSRWPAPSGAEFCEPCQAKVVLLAATQYFLVCQWAEAA